MEKIIKKINEEYLDFNDLKKVANYLLDDNATKIIEGKEPYYNVTRNEIVLNSETISPWFLGEYIEYIRGYKIKNILTNDDKEKIKNLRQCHNISLYNYILLNAVAHEVRHANQNIILKDQYENYNYDFLKTLLQVKLKNTMDINTMYHDFLYHEYDADMYALNFINDLNKEVKSVDINEFNRYGAYKILRGYLNIDRNNISCPLENSKIILDSIDDTIMIMKCIEEHYESLKSLISCYDGYTYYDVFKYLNNYNKIDENTFEARLLRGDKLNSYELNLIKDIYVNNLKCNDFKRKIKEKTYDR